MQLIRNIGPLALSSSTMTTEAVFNKNNNETFSMSDLWELCIKYEYDEELLVRSLSDWISKSGFTKILDASCGTGFPALRLIRNGFDITCCDGSQNMLERFIENAEDMGVKNTPHKLLWEETHSVFPEEFDLIMCRGSSLIYAGCWDINTPPNRSAIFDALSSFYESLQPGGVLYVDTTREENLASDEAEHHSYPILRIGSTEISLSETVNTDRENKIRTWSSIVKANNKEYRFVRRSHYLPHNELIGILNLVGFKDVHRLTIDGERYAVFTARRAE